MTVSRAASLEQVLKAHPKAMVIAPARTKDALIAAVYLAVDAPDYAGDNLDALADILRDLSWVPSGPVQLAWMISPKLPAGVRRQVEEIFADVSRTTVRSARPLSVHLVEQGAT